MKHHSMIKKAVVLFIFTWLSTVSAASYANSEQVKLRLNKQINNIQKGVRLGQLTIAEKNTLTDEQLRITKTYKKMLTDNKIDSIEKKRLFKMLHQSSLKIFDLRYNKDRKK